jgi:hypothetical protein
MFGETGLKTQGRSWSLLETLLSLILVLTSEGMRAGLAGRASSKKSHPSCSLIIILGWLNVSYIQNVKK